MLRTVLLVSLVAYMQAGSFLRLGLDIKEPWYTKSWRMYSNRGSDECALTVYQLHDDGSRTELERWWEHLGAETVFLAPHAKAKGDRLKIGRRLCRALPDTQLSVVARCGKKGGFRKPTKTADVDVCNPRHLIRDAIQKVRP